ncbi:MAG: carbohydrate ABC transporter permease [Oscillospiraceae bacterium]|nr:carbohydrate ABC transporter permease [Oscillospiraceae bacterium]
MLYKDIGLLNNFLVYILPSAVSTFNMILMKNYFEHLPVELEESAMIDGASTLKILWKVIMPLAMPIIATISIFTGVGQWNSWFDAYMFVPKRTDLHPLQTYLYRVISLSQISTENPMEMQLLERLRTNVTTIRAATVMITTIPIIFIYSLFQKHFIKGAMVGALKG